MKYKGKGNFCGGKSLGNAKWSTFRPRYVYVDISIFKV